MASSMMEDHLWSLANVVTGFSVAQNIAFLYALGKDLARIQEESVPVKWPLAIPVVLFTALYLCAVWEIYRITPMESGEQLIWLRVTQGRTVAITAFALMAIAGLFAPDLYRAFGRTGRQADHPPATAGEKGTN